MTREPPMGWSAGSSVNDRHRPTFHTNGGTAFQQCERLLEAKRASIKLDLKSIMRIEGVKLGPARGSKRQSSMVKQPLSVRMPQNSLPHAFFLPLSEGYHFVNVFLAGLT